MGWSEYQVGSNISTRKFVEYQLGRFYGDLGKIVKIEQGEAQKIGRGRFKTAFYVAVKSELSGETYATVYLTERKNGQILIKKIDETEGPCYYEASVRFINLLSKPQNMESAWWRNRCFEKYSEKENA
jgi:hypothetical protein